MSWVQEQWLRCHRNKVSRIEVTTPFRTAKENNTVTRNEEDFRQAIGAFQKLTGVNTKSY